MASLTEKNGKLAMTLKGVTKVLNKRQVKALKDCNGDEVMETRLLSDIDFILGYPKIDERAFIKVQDKPNTDERGYIMLTPDGTASAIMKANLNANQMAPTIESMKNKVIEANLNKPPVPDHAVERPDQMVVEPLPEPPKPKQNKSSLQIDMADSDIPRAEVIPEPPVTPPQPFKSFTWITEQELRASYYWQGNDKYAASSLTNQRNATINQLKNSLGVKTSPILSRYDIGLLFKIILLDPKYCYSEKKKGKSVFIVDFSKLDDLNASFCYLESKREIKNDLRSEIEKVFAEKIGANIHDYRISVVGGALSESIRSAQYLDGIPDSPNETIATGLLKTNMCAGSLPAEIAETMYQDGGMLDGRCKMVGGPDSIPYFNRKGYKVYEPAVVATGVTSTKKKNWTPQMI